MTQTYKQRFYIGYNQGQIVPGL